MVHWGRELLSEARYFHSVSMLDDPLRIRRAVEKHGLKLSALSSHSQLSKPEIAVEYLKQAARYAAECGAPVINTHEGHKQDVDQRGRGLRADPLLDHGGRQGLRAPRHQARAGDAPDLLAHPGQVRPHLEPGLFAQRGRELRHGQRLSRRHRPHRLARADQAPPGAHARQGHQPPAIGMPSAAR